MALRITRVVQTTESVPAQWDAWTDEGQYLYLRYRQGRGSVTPYPSPDWELWDPAVQPVIEWDDKTDGYDINLADFLKAAHMQLACPARPKRLHTRLCRLTTR